MFWFIVGHYKNTKETEDIEIIIRTVQESPNESKAHLTLFGLV